MDAENWKLMKVKLALVSFYWFSSSTTIGEKRETGNYTNHHGKCYWVNRTRLLGRDNDWKLAKIQMIVTYTGQVRRVANDGRTPEWKKVKDIKGHFKSRTWFADELTGPEQSKTAKSILLKTLKRTNQESWAENQGKSQKFGWWLLGVRTEYNIFCNKWR